MSGDLKLSKGDKFKHINGEDKEIYTISNIKGERVTVSWDKRSVVYSLSDALNYISEGRWIILEDNSYTKIDIKPLEPNRCICDINDLMNLGCRCGGI